MLFRHKNKKNLKKRRLSLEPIIPRRITSQKSTKKISCGRAVLYISKKVRYRASMTVEAAVIVPLFLIAMFTLISVIDVCRIHVIKQTEFRDQAKQVGTLAYGAESYMEDPYVDLYEVYPYALPISLLPNYKINLALRGRVHAWIGKTPSECEKDKKRNSEDMVYVTDHQAVYHTNAGCSYLELSVYAVGKTHLSEARNDSGGRYACCEKCCGSSEVTIYYITANGSHYHTSRSCSGLTRNVRLVPKSEVEHLSCCTRCQGG